MTLPRLPEPTDAFARRHIGPGPDDERQMLERIGVVSLDALIDQVIPADIRRTEPLAVPPAESEFGFLSRLRAVAARNHDFRSFIGTGYYDCITPSVIQRTVLENPSWYTPYTPYQAEIAQGRLESLLNFQTIVRDLTAMEVANASLLDEGTAAAEAMMMLHRVSPRRAEASVFLVSKRTFPQTLDVIVGRAEPLGIEVRIAEPEAFEFDERVFGCLLQNPDGDGRVWDPSPVIRRAHQSGALVAVATDLLASTLFTPPGEHGADIVVGSAQRFGVPLGYGGPHAAFFATREAHVRQAPGRIIGVSVDARGNQAYRMALQTREQHIRREKATSNICTAQALLANIAAFYGVYHGPHGVTQIARRVHGLTQALHGALVGLGYRQLNDHYFDTVKVLPAAAGSSAARVKEEALKARVNLRYFADGEVGLSLDETTSLGDVEALAGIFARACGSPVPAVVVPPFALQGPPALVRTSRFMTQPVFNTHHSETAMMRYVKMLERRDVGLDTSMIPLGSCTMKLNAASEMMPITWPGFSRLHPFVPTEQAQGYADVFRDLETSLKAITGFAGVSLQPNSGAQGEFAGLMVIRAYHRDRGQAQREVVLVPSSAHGTNPASAAMAGMQVAVVACDAKGNVDVADLEAKAERYKDTLAALMVTYPSTHGVYEASIRRICAIVHQYGGQVYMDGANMNAQVGLTSPALIGADVCHINLHKTFAIPHGGGGPGMGPIAVAPHLVPYLPGHPVVKTGGGRAIPATSAAPWGSASILLISYAYMRMLGPDGMTAATKYAILNANYVKARLAELFPVLFVGANDRVAHELIFDLRPLKQASGIDETDVAKRLMDFGFHAPTISFPVPGTIMVEPTESENKAELDRFCDALAAIRGEIQDVIDGKLDAKDNPLKNAPHTAHAVSADDWAHAYSRQRAAYPLDYLRHNKFWPSVGRIDNPYGDRHLVCACGPVEDYAMESDRSPG
ncbi:MAG: aminomethyl-transferring glycine dehydrogenase [Vicinamibacterales bacterium]